ncbi:MAG: cofactor assembly of complex C subunit B [Crocosphaera sp.]|nr:cofactor assembly of complex C subunit B [Crocosphaera sp.]
MNTPILISTFFLTLLLMVGLFFFIRASVKDRTEQVKLISPVSITPLLEELKTYFTQRAYNLIGTENNTLTFEGMVRPSWFLAIFLSILAGFGLLCFGLVLSFIYPPLTSLFLGLAILAPLAGIFYWQKARRVEKISLSLESLTEKGLQQGSLLTLTAHRDEVIQIKQALALKPPN